MTLQRWFQGPAGPLDARIHGPGDGTPVLILHPHPQFQGTMGSRFVYDTAKLLADHGFRAVRFDYRGVNRSEGHYSNGDGETTDAVAVWDTLAAEGAPPIVVGFSFGGGVACRLARSKVGQMPRLVLVATPPQVSHSSLSPRDDAPHITGRASMVVGDSDTFVPVPAAGALAKRFPDGCDLTVVPKAGHFLVPEEAQKAAHAVLRILQA